MGTNLLGEYIESIRERHPQLSMRQMALDAGIGPSTIRGIIRDSRGALPATLKKIADAWGTEGDYREMMRLAGCPLPEDDAQRTLARLAGLSGISLDFWQAVYDGDDQALATQSSDITQADERALDQDRSSFGIEDFWQISGVMLKLLRSASPERRAQILSTLAEHARQIRAGDRPDAP